MPRETKECNICNRNISLSNFNKHYDACKKPKKQKISINEDWKQENGLYECPYCKNEFKHWGIGAHIWKNHTSDGLNHVYTRSKFKEGQTSWNKGLTKLTDSRINTGIEKFQKNLKEGKFIPHQKGKSLSDLAKQKVSDGMKLAHKEGRAWNIGKSRWNNKPSYPEEFFMKVIQNEFEDKNVQTEFPVGIYSLDFAWIKKNKVIEIDGGQHQRFQEYIERDKRKDTYLTDNGWKILRIPWNTMYNNTKETIQLCKDFIDNQ
jgi:very-short-patch-repair endonuclease